MKATSFLCGLLAAVSCSGAQSQGLYDNLPLRELVKTEVPVSYLSANEDGSVFLDFGRDAFSQIRLVVDAERDHTVKVHLGEAMEDFRFDESALAPVPYEAYGRKSFHVDRKPGGTVRYCCYELELKAGVHSYGIAFRPDRRNTVSKPIGSGAVAVLMPGSVGEVYPFRYCEIEGLHGSIVRDETRQIAVHYPFDWNASSFESSDPSLNKVWDLCKYSIKATSFCGYYVDGDRERIPYEADALLNLLSHYGVDSEYAMGRRTAAYLLENPTWPTEWHLEMVLMAWADYMYTGDKALLVKYYDVIRAKTLIALREENGLISTCTGKMTADVKKSINYRGTDSVKDIVDWPRSGSFGIDKKEAGEADGYVMTDYNAVVNAIHYETLVLMSRIAMAVGNRKDASFFKSEASSFIDRFNASFTDPADGIYRDGIGTEHKSLHANMFPLLFGMVPEKNRAAVIGFIRSRGMACSVYGSQFLMDALYSSGEAEYALSLLTSRGRRGWINMLRRGSTITMEAWDNVFKSNLDWNHAWGAAPANIISRRLVGVRPLKPGFSEIVINPQPAGLEWFKSLVPSPKGGIACNYRRLPDGNVILEVSVPAGVRFAEIVLDCPVKARAELVSETGRICTLSVRDGRTVARVKSGNWTVKTSAGE